MASRKIIKKPENSLHYEAYLWKNFYDSLRKISKIRFGPRSYNPPKDEVNALISFVNALLYGHVLKCILKTSLDPQLSYIHSNKKRFNLVYDLADIYKPYYVCNFVIRIINLGIIKKEDFDNLRLKQNAKRKVISEFDKFLNKTVFHKRLKRYISMKGIIQEDVYGLVRHLKGSKLEFFKKWW